MKIGRDRTPLKERLNQQAESQVHQAADLMQSALKTFETDCTSSLSAARRTIESDIQSLMKSSRQMRPVIVTASLMNLIVILMSLAASWYWASLMIDKAQSASLWQLGLTIHQTNNGTVLSMNEKRLKLIECRIGTASAKCLQILEKE